MFPFATLRGRRYPSRYCPSFARILRLSCSEGPGCLLVGSNPQQSPPHRRPSALPWRVAVRSQSHRCKSCIMDDRAKGRFFRCGKLRQQSQAPQGPPPVQSGCNAGSDGVGRGPSESPYHLRDEEGTETSPGRTRRPRKRAAMRGVTGLGGAPPSRRTICATRKGWKPAPAGPAAPAKGLQCGG